MEIGNAQKELHDLTLGVVGAGLYDLLIFIFPALWILVRTVAGAKTEIGNKYPFLIEMLIVCLCWGFFISIYFVLARVFPHHEVAFFAVLNLALLGFCGWKVYPLTKLHSVGIQDSDRAIGKGLNYRDSLNRCHTNLMFLGVGASKLTELDEFKEAIQRCQQHGSVKLLLSAPDNPLLVPAARGADLDENEYKNKIIASLKRIRDIKTLATLIFK